jgi:hypothetical protein
MFVPRDGDDPTFAATGAPEGSAGVVSHAVADLERAFRCDSGIPRMLGEVRGRVTAVARDALDRIVVETAGPTEIFRIDGNDVVPLLSAPRGLSPTDLALRDFHRATPAGVACASCHPEGADDGNVWEFFHGDGFEVSDIEVRRTMSLSGEVLLRTPYHWDGTLPGPEDLMADTFTNRMAGGVMAPEDTARLFDWIDGLRPVRANPGRKEDVVARGRALFDAAGCADCHSGPAFTDGLVHAVRLTDLGPTKTPTLLGVGSREPLLHDGCAATLEARFAYPCDGGNDRHGRLSTLDEPELDALIAYVRTL